MVGLENVRHLIADGSCDLDGRKPTAVVAVCLLETASGLDVLFEVRAEHLKRQPGEVCLPGGRIDGDESPRDAVVREISEELLVDASCIEILGDLGETDGPGGFKVAVFAAVIREYRGTFNTREVGCTFTKPLTWFLENEPEVHVSRLEPRMPDGFPWELVPGGRDYPFHGVEQDVCFYRGTNPLIWGFTARVMRGFAQALTVEG